MGCNSKKPIPLPSVELLNSLFTYNPETGDLYRKPLLASDGKWYVSDSKRPMRRKHSFRDKTYYRCNLPGHGNKPQFMVHRIVFKMYHGFDPVEVDHINGIGTDNRIANLRSVERVANCRNVRMSKANTTGCVGVHRVKSKDKWVARIEVDGKRIHLGFHEEFSDAVKARKEAEIFYGFHVNHGLIKEDQN